MGALEIEGAVSYLHSGVHVERSSTMAAVEKLSEPLLMVLHRCLDVTGMLMALTVKTELGRNLVLGEENQEEIGQRCAKEHAVEKMEKLTHEGNRGREALQVAGNA